MIEERRCTAHRKNGDRCKHAAINGGTVCRNHGGAAPQVKKAAQARIDALADPAITQLARLIDFADTDAVKLSAVKDALDRAGFKPTEKRETKVDGNLSIADIRQALVGE